MIDVVIERKIIDIDRQTMAAVEDTLKKIDIALHLNVSRLKSKKIPNELKRLMEWKKALLYWKERYGQESDDLVFIAERLGAFYDICATTK